MFAKVILFCTALAAAHSTLLAPVGLGAPVLSSGHLGYNKGYIATPGIATVSSQKSVINHAAPAAHVAVAPAPVAFAGHGILTKGLIGGHGISAAPLTVGTSIYGAPAAIGVGSHGYGHGVISSQKSVINHVAPSAPIAVARAPVALASHGIVGGHGIAASPLAVGKSIYGTPLAVGVGSHGYGHGVAVSSQKSVINHVAPASRIAVAPIGLSSHGLVGGHGIAASPLAVGKSIYGTPLAVGVGSHGYGHGVAVSSQKSVINHVAPAASIAVAPIGLSSHGLVGGHGIAAAPLAVGKSVYGAPVAVGVGSHGYGHGIAVSSQKSVINHVAPPAPVAVAAAPILSNHGVYGNSLLTNGLVGGHGIAAAPLGIGNGLLGAPIALSHGAAVSSQKSVISHAAPASRLAVATAPVSLAHNGLIGGHGIVGSGLNAGYPLGIAGHGYSALPLSIGSGIHGAPIALGLGKHIY